MLRAAAWTGEAPAPTGSIPSFLAASGRIPLCRCGMGVQPWRQAGPDQVAVGDVEPCRRWPARFDEGAASGQVPVRGRVADDPVRPGPAGPFRAGPPLLIGRPAYDVVAGNG